MLSPIVNIYKLGRTPYLSALEIQKVLFNRLKEGVCNKTNYENSLLLVEHEPVYTIGLRTKNYDDNYVTRLKRELDSHNLKADFVETNRGGLITYHGPGQLVAYPILHLSDFTRSLGEKKSLKAYVNSLENTIIDTLDRIGLPGAHTTRQYPGVWLDEGQRKIAFVGIYCNRYVTMHGVSINCDCDLSWFDHIVSCGIQDREITSIDREMAFYKRPSREDFSSLHNDISSPLLKSEQRKKSSINDEWPPQESLMSRVTEAFCKSFTEHFDCTILKRPAFNW